MTVHNVDPGDVISFYNSSSFVAGDEIVVQTNGVEHITVPGTQWVMTKPGTIRADTRGAYDSNPLGDGLGSWSPRFERRVHFQGSIRISASSSAIAFVDTAHTFNPAYFPDWFGAGETWQSKGYTWAANYWEALCQFMGASTTCGLILSGTEFYGGIDASHTPFPVGTKLPDFDSPTHYYQGTTVNDGTCALTTGVAGYSNTPFTTTGWDDSSPRNARGNIAYNALRYGPGPSYGDFAFVDVEDLYTHDTLGRGFVVIIGGTNGYLSVERFWIERYYTDSIQYSFRQGINTSYSKVQNGIAWNPVGNGKDLNDPHSDAVQGFGGIQPSEAPMFGIETNNIIIGSDPTNRDTGQAIFSVYDDGLSMAHAIGPKARNLLILGANKGVHMWGAKNAYVRNVTSINPHYFAGELGSLVADIQTMRAGKNIIAPAGMQYVANSVGEGISADTLRSGGNNVSLALRSSAQTTLFVDASPPASPNEAYENFKTVSGQQGPEYDTLRQMLSATSFSGELVAAQALPIVGAATNTLQTSELIFVHGGDKGEILPVTVSGGIEWRQVDIDGTTATNWTTEPGDFTLGKYLQIRQTSAATGSTTTQNAYTVRGQEFTWPITTLSSNRYPSVATSAARLQKATPGITGATNSSKISGILIFEPSNLSATNRQIMASTDERLRLTTYAGAWYFRCRDTLGFNIVNWTTSDDPNVMVVGQREAIAFSIDAAQASQNDGFIFKRKRDDGVFVDYFAGSWGGGSGKLLPIETTTFSFLGLVGGGQHFEGEFFLGALWPGEFIDWNDHLDKIDPDNPDMIGPRGAGILGTPAPVFIPGRADRFAAGTANWGTGGAFPQIGTAATQADNEPWSPVLNLVADVQPGPLEVGKKVEIWVFATGSPKQVGITPSANLSGSFDEASTTLAEGSIGALIGFTPSEPGSLVISFSNDGGYGNPSNVTRTIAQGEEVVDFGASQPTPVLAGEWDARVTLYDAGGHPAPAPADISGSYTITKIS